jgi:hypothetical protein
MRLTSRGFTAIELAAALGITGMLIAASFHAYCDALPGMRVKAAARELFANLHRARIAALATGAPVAVTLNGPRNSYTVGSETIPMDSENPGVRFGAVAGTPPWDATRGLTGGIAIPPSADGTLPADQFTIDRHGRPSRDGEIYLIHVKDLAAGRTDRTYCIAVRQIGTYRLLRYDGTSWQ